MSIIKAYIESFRLRTLPLSLSGIILGIMLAANEGITNFFTVIFLINTTLSLQILSNLANEYGDMVKGTDNKDRLGPIRSIQSGILSKVDIMRAIVVFIVLSITNGIALLFLSLDHIFSTEGLTFLALGGASILAALFYTIGKHAYGYKGMGDIFVFIFFGLVSTLGAYVLSGGLNIAAILLPAISIGLLSCAVLNINNMRDIDNDKRCDKHTVAVRLGTKRAKIYHAMLIILALSFQSIYYFHIENGSGLPWFYLCVPILLFHLWYISKHEGRDLDKQMPVLPLTTLAFAFLCGI